MKPSISDILSKPGERFLTISKEAVNKDTRTVSLSFSSETPVEFYFGYEILDHSPGACDLSLLNDGAPLMDNHRSMIGKIETASIDGDKIGRCMARFSKAARAEEMYQDVIDEIRTKTSVGYRRLAMVLEKTENGIDTYRTTKWQPYEVTLADIPADTSVGVGRTVDAQNNSPLPLSGVKTMIPEEIAAAEAAARQAERGRIDSARTAERTRIAEIDATASRFSSRVPTMNSIREKAVNEGWSEDRFRAAVLESMPEATPVTNTDPNIGLSDKEIRSYSIMRAVSRISEGLPLDGIEAEASRAFAKLARRDIPNKGFIIPNDVMAAHAKRALSTQSGSAGGYTVGTQVLGGETVELLRNKMMVERLGARKISGLVGNIAIPKITGGAVVYWLSSNGTVNFSDQSFGQLGMVPHRMVAATAYDKELVNQSSLSIENFVRDDINRVSDIEKDRVAINGSGTAGQPTGLLNLETGLGTVTFGGAPTWAKIVEFETTVATANADSGSLGYMMTPGVRGKLKGVQQAANLPFIWQPGTDGMGVVNGYPAGATNQVPLNKVLFGNWADMIIGEWAGVDVVVDPFTLAANGQIRLIITQWCDIGVRHAASFAVSTDAGNQ